MQSIKGSGILIVDDIPENIMYLEALLVSFKSQILKAYSGREAIELIEGKNIAVALIDINMPKMDGIELARRISADPKRDKVPIIFVSSYSRSDEQLRKCYEAGGVDYIMKPFQREILISKVKVFLELDSRKSQIIENRNKLEYLTNELNELNKLLTTSELRYRNLLEQSLQGQVIIQNGKIVLINKAFERLSGYAMEEILNFTRQQVLDLINTIASKFDYANYLKILDGKEMMSLREYQAKDRDGKNVWFQVITNRIDYDDQPAIHAIFNDITPKMLVEDELRKIFELSLDLLCVMDIDQFTFKKVNPAFTRVLGYPIEFFIGKKLIDFVHPDDQDQTNHKLKGSIKGIDINNFENRIRCSDGTFKWLSWVSHPVVNMGLAYTIAHDVTQRKLAEVKIKESERIYRTLLNASPEGIVIMDLEGMIIEVSDIMLELFEANSKKEFNGISFLKLMDETEIPKLRNLLLRTLEDGLVQNVEFILSTRKHSKLIAEISTTLIQDSDGKPRSFMAIIRDISSRKQMEQQLIHSERLAGIGEMAASIAHELNQPLNNISISLENLLQEVSNSKAIEGQYLYQKSQNIFENLERMENIIDHVRAFSRGLDDTFRGLFDITSSIRNGIMLVAQQFNNLGIELVHDESKKIPPCIGNTYKFEQVIVNLLINAKDALEEKGKTIASGYHKQISIRSGLQKNIVTIEVRDNGCGILPQDLTRVMLPFFSTKQEGRGTGLGLSITYNIIKEMNGKIKVESESGEGTCITIQLPVYKSQ